MGRAGRPAIEIVTEALAATPEATVAVLAAGTGLGGSTVGKALTLLEEHGRARRVPGGRDAGRRLADQWTPITAAAAEAGDMAKGATMTEPDIAEPAAPRHGRESRLGRGQLDRLVLNQLRASDGQPVTVGAVAKALDRSAGAVSNCLQRLTASQQVNLVEEAPRRYTLT